MGRNWKRKLLSTFLAFALCLTMVPESALAGEITSGNAVVRQEQTGASKNGGNGNSSAATETGKDGNSSAATETGKDGNSGAAEGAGKDGNSGAVVGTGKNQNSNVATGNGEDQNSSVSAGNGEDENDDVSAGNGAENDGVENGDGNYADPQNGEEAENGIALFSNDDCLHENVDNGTCEGCGTVFAAKNTNQNKLYEFLSDALENAANGETVTLLADNQVLNRDAEIISDEGEETKTVTLDLNGKICNCKGYDALIRLGAVWDNTTFSTTKRPTTLKIVGNGSILQSNSISASIYVYPGSTLDLTGWEGGEITHVAVDGSNSQSSVITGNIPAAGKIGTLELIGEKINLNIALNGGSYGTISVLNGQDIYANSILAEGYAFKNEDGTFVPYKQQITGIYNVTVVKCNHEYTNEDEVWTDGTCNACGYVCPHSDVQDGVCQTCKAVFTAQNVNQNKLYQSLSEALKEAANGETVILLADNQSMDNDVKLTGELTITLNLNGRTSSGSGLISIGKIDQSDSVTLKLVGNGNLLQTDPRYASICVYGDNKLDLTDWEGGEITHVAVAGTAKIVSENIPETCKIGKLELQSISGKPSFTLDGGSYGVITASNNSVQIGSLLAEGYAFKNADGTLVPYNKEVIYPDSDITNVTIVKCTAHQDADGDRVCDGCNAGPLAAGVNDEYYYTSLSDAWNAAVEMNNGSTVKLLKEITAADQSTLSNLTTGSGEIGLDLNGFSLSSMIFNVKGLLALKNSSETDVTIGAINLNDGGGLDIQSDTITVDNLNVSGSGAELTRGNFKNIAISKTGVVLINLVADGYAFADATTGALIDNSQTSTNTAVKIIEHTHKFQGSDPCTCGYTCEHDVDADGMCTKCRTQYEAKVETADGKVTYYAAGINAGGNSATGLFFALEAAPDGSTVYPLRKQGAQGNLDGSEKSTRTLNLNEITMSDGGGIRVAAYSELPQTLILAGDGYMDSTVFVQDRGVLRTKDLQGKIRTLWIYPGADVKLAGGTYGQILRNSDSCIAGEILEAGYVFRAEDGSFIKYDKQITNSDTLNNVTVVECDEHSDSDGDLSCDYCKASLAASVTVGSEVRYFTTAREVVSMNAIPAAVAYANANSGTIRPLVDDIAIYNANCKIDLNGKTVVCITAGGSDLVVKGEGTVRDLYTDTESGSAKLYGGSYENIGTHVGSTTLGDLLPDGYGFKKADGSWLTAEELAKSGTSILKGNNIGIVTVAQSPIKKLTVDAPESITYSDELKITATAEKADSASDVTYKWYKDGDELSNLTEAVLTLSGDEYGDVGEYIFKCVAACDGYEVSKEVTVTVEKADLANAELEIISPERLVFTPSGRTRVAYRLTYNGEQLTNSSTHSVSGNYATEAGEGTLTVTGKGNYTGEKSIKYVVKPYPISALTIEGNWSKPYDGTTDISGVTPTTVTLTYYNSIVSFTEGTDYVVEAADFDSAAVGTDKTVTIKLKLLNKNYTFADDKTEGTFTCNSKGSITQAKVTPAEGELIVMNGWAKTYTVDLAELLPKLTAPQTYGEITYGLRLVQMDPGYYVVESAKIENGVLSLSIDEVDTDTEDKIGTITVGVSTTNYEDMLLTINVKATNKVVPVGAPTLSRTTLTYGERLGDIALSGSMRYENTTVAGTFAWVSPDARPDITSAYMAEWIFTPTDSKAYVEVRGTVQISVNKATPRVAELPTTVAQAYNPSKTLGNIGLSGGKVLDAGGNPIAGTWRWQTTGIVPTVDNKGYVAVFTPNDSTRYNQTTANIAVNVERATPVITVKPTAAGITYGKCLGASVLSGGTAVYSDQDGTVIAGSFRWTNEGTVPTVADSNTTRYEVTFIPADAVNYAAAQAEITVPVQKASAAPNMPDSTMEVSNATEKVGDISLPYGWVWRNADRDTLLNVNEAVKATAVYSGTDKGNYETESVEISITRADAGDSNSGDVAEDNKKDDSGEEDNKPDSDTEKPFVKDDSSKSGWELITDRIKNTEDGETVVVDMNGTTSVPADVFEYFKGMDVNVQFDMGDGIVWTVNGKDITGVEGDIDLGVVFGSEAGKTIPVDVINTVTGERYSINLTLAHNGEFGFTATLTVNMKAENAGYYANLYYYNPDSNELEFVCAGQIDKAGNVDLTFTHASDYTIVLTEAAMSGVITPKVDDHGTAWTKLWILLVGCAVVVVGLGIFFIVSRKKSDKRA